MDRFPGKSFSDTSLSLSEHRFRSKSRDATQSGSSSILRTRHLSLIRTKLSHYQAIIFLERPKETQPENEEKKERKTFLTQHLQSSTRKVILQAGDLFVRHDPGGQLNLCNRRPKHKPTIRPTERSKHAKRHSKSSFNVSRHYNIEEYIFFVKESFSGIKKSGSDLVTMECHATFELEYDGVIYYLCARSGLDIQRKFSVILDPKPYGALWKLKAVSDKTYIMESELFRSQVVAVGRHGLVLKRFSKHHWRLSQRGMVDKGCCVTITPITELGFLELGQITH